MRYREDIVLAVPRFFARFLKKAWQNFYGALSRGALIGV